jgi:hypothetical protein
MMNEITESEWAKKYQPKPNCFTNDGYSYETYGHELEYVCLQPHSTVWTEMDGDEGVYIVAGYHLANRIQYYITEIPWTDDEEPFVTICKYVECECVDADGEGKQDCETCDGDGMYTEWSMD